jgi:hypothetical protein
MWESTLITLTDVPAEALWAAAADEDPGEDTDARTDCRGGPPAAPPFRRVVVTRLFLARAETVYEFSPVAGATRVRVGARLAGPLAVLYRRSFAARLDDGLSSLVGRLIERARAARPARAS